MTQDIQVGVKELKNRLSAYLREVRKGRRVLVTREEMSFPRIPGLCHPVAAGSA